MNLRYLLILLVVTFSLRSNGWATTVYLKNGRILDGTIENEDSKSIQLNVNGNMIVLLRENIREIEKKDVQKYVPAVRETSEPTSRPDFNSLYDAIEKQDLAKFKLIIAKSNTSLLSPDEMIEFNYLRKYAGETAEEVNRILKKYDYISDRLDDATSRKIITDGVSEYPFSRQMREKYIECLRKRHVENEDFLLFKLEHSFLFPKNEFEYSRAKKELLGYSTTQPTDNENYSAFLLIRLYAVLLDDAPTTFSDRRICLEAIQDIRNNKRSQNHPLTFAIDRKTASVLMDTSSSLAKNLKYLVLIHMHNELSDEAIRSLGLPSKNALMDYQEQKRNIEQQEIFQREEEQRKYAALQKSRGFIEFRGRWMTPEEKIYIQKREQEESYIAQAHQIMVSKSKEQVPFKVIQVLNDRALCFSGRYSSFLKDYIYDGETFELQGISTDTMTDGETYKYDLYWAGTYSYTTVRDIDKKVNSYCLQPVMALGIIRLKYGLYDKYAASQAANGGYSKPVSPEATSQQIKGTGSGFAITEDGYILTNEHVVHNSTGVWIHMETSEIPAQIIATDKNYDLALLKCSGKFKALRFADPEHVQLGQDIYSIGYPNPLVQGFSTKVTKGIISSINGVRDDTRWYQIDSPIQPGNSGGPVVNKNGDVIGIVNAGINEFKYFESSNSLPQNINYCVKNIYAIDFLKKRNELSDKIKINSKNNSASKDDNIPQAMKSTYLILVR